MPIYSVSSLSHSFGPKEVEQGQDFRIHHLDAVAALSAVVLRAHRVGGPPVNLAPLLAASQIGRRRVVEG